MDGRGSDQGHWRIGGPRLVHVASTPPRPAESRPPAEPPREAAVHGEKVLWTAGYNTLPAFINKAVEIGATAVAVRTDAALARAIPACRARGIRVYGWASPPALRDPAMAEADRAVELLECGLDGYIVVPAAVGDAASAWNEKGLGRLASDFCRRVAGAARGRPFGVAGHYRAAAAFPLLPWRSFFDHAQLLLPQAFWRGAAGTIGHGLPDDSLRAAIGFWTAAGAERARIVPIAGELAFARRDEIAVFAAEAARQGIRSLHVHGHDSRVPVAVWRAVAEAVRPPALVVVS